MKRNIRMGNRTMRYIMSAAIVLMMILSGCAFAENGECWYSDCRHPENRPNWRIR